ncbi:EH signature domain-containing protein [Jiella marina]|uniref:EH signature domain-containing protein n=1 Tax=Jiella sp. LLJ827 TaxID=2917712 RepID=UPI002101CA53|nr:EH signature domain-containing protein [Jiella sp. LLJ827]MCQ0987166.1 EH signature domain-containing protein [Jiella sp. LLJ827]
MSSFREALREVSVRHGGRPAPHRRAQIVMIAEDLQLPEGGQKINDRDYDAIAARVASRLADGGRLTANEARDGAWCLWETQTRLAASEMTLLPFLEQLFQLRRKAAVRSLALSYLYSFRPNLPGLDAVAGTLANLVELAGRPFDALQRDYAIFDPSKGPRRVAEEAKNSQTPPSGLLQSLGLNALSVRAGFAEACAGQALRLLADEAQLAALERLSFVKAIALDEKDELFFPSHGPQVANALLLPFAANQPSEEICDRYLDLLIGLFGDPRTNEGRWVNMPEAAEIARRWLTRQALRQFLDVVDAVAPDAMWSYRRTFWEAVYDRKLIQTAWVVFDSAGVAEARRRFGSKVQFGRFEKGGSIQSGHSVLLLRIGRAVVAEWSHSGMCRLWKDADREGAPVLYRRSYAADELRWPTQYQAEFEQRHYPHSGPGAWQHKVANAIFDAVGARIPQEEYL